MEELAKIFNLINTSKTKPILHTVNGIGCDLFGRFSLYFMDDLVFKINFICIVFIPIIPIGIYLVKVDEINPIEGSTYTIYGKMSAVNFFKLFGYTAIPKLIFTIFGDIIGKLVALAIALALLTAIGYALG